MKKFIPSTPHYESILAMGNDLIALIELQKRFRVVCRTILFAESTSEGAKRRANAGIYIGDANAIANASFHLLCHIEHWNAPGSFHVKNTLKSIVAKEDHHAREKNGR